jgi:hypothetical protein
MAITKATASSIAPAAKGDLVAGSATNDAAVLGVGANDTVLTADSSTATGLKWAAAASPSYTWTSFTPAFQQGAALTQTNTNCAYAIVGDIGFISIKVTFTSAGTANNILAFDIIGSGALTSVTEILGGGVSLYDTSTTQRYIGSVENAGNYFYFTSGVNKANATINWGQTGSDFPIAIASGDQLRAFVVYKKA